MDKPFVSDGCSGAMSWVWRKVTGNPPPWEGACVEHDRAYWKGGSRQDRLVADTKLLLDVSVKHPWWGIAMFFAVRVFGHPTLSTSWRWGYGWNKKGYTDGQ